MGVDMIADMEADKFFDPKLSSKRIFQSLQVYSQSHQIFRILQHAILFDLNLVQCHKNGTKVAFIFQTSAHTLWQRV